MTVTLQRQPSRADLYLVREIVKDPCGCPEAAKVTKDETDSLLCRPCRLRKRWNEVLKVLDEG